MVHSQQIISIDKISLSEFMQALAYLADVLLSFNFWTLKLFDLRMQLLEYDGSVVG